MNNKPFEKKIAAVTQFHVVGLVKSLTERLTEWEPALKQKM